MSARPTFAAIPEPDMHPVTCRISRARVFGGHARRHGTHLAPAARAPSHRASGLRGRGHRSRPRRSRAALECACWSPRSPSHSPHHGVDPPGPRRIRAPRARNQARRLTAAAASAGSDARRLPGKRRGERVVDVLDPDEGELLARVGRDVLEVAAVARRQHHGGDAGAQRGQHLLLDAADRQHEPAQADLARSSRRRCAPSRPVSSDASATNIATPALGPSLGVAPAGTWMWMSDFSNSSGAMPRSLRARLDERQRRLRALLHHVAELPGQDQLAARPACAWPR